MKTKQSVLLGLGGLALLSGLLAAAVDAPPPPATPGHPPPPRGELAPRAHTRLADQLGLTADQQAKFDELRQKQRAELDALRDNPELTPADRRAKARAIGENYRAQRHALLTPEQQQKADELRARMPERRAHPGSRAQRGEHFQQMMRAVAQGEQIKDRLAEKLQLTNEQRDKLERLGREFRAKQREAMKAHLAEMRAVLTPEQQEKVDEWKKGRGPGHFGPGRPDDLPPPSPDGEDEGDEEIGGP
jgi:Spy/CpxP family protein refolding chaperone